MGDTPTPARRSRRRTILLIAAAVGAVLVLLSLAAVLYTEVLWYREIGYSSVFRTVFWTRVGLGVAFGAVFAAALLANIWMVRRIVPADRATKVPEQFLARYRVTLEPLKKPGLAGLGLLAGIFAGLRASKLWREYLLWRHPVRFGTRDPVFHKDLGFFVFKVPFLRAVFGWTFASLVVIAIVVAATHYVRGGIRPQRGGERVSPAARAHLSILIGLLVLLKAWGYRLDQFDLLSSNRGVVQGAGYTDVHARLPALWVLLGVAVVAGVLLVANAWKRTGKLPRTGIVLLAVSSIVVGGVYPAAVQRLKVNPDERTLEAEYIQHNIDATRNGFGLANVKTVPFGPVGEISRTTEEQRFTTIGNIRLWAPDVLQSVYANLQRLKQYYRFVSPTDTDRYARAEFGSGSPAGGAPSQQWMVAAREISPSGLSTEARTWVNTHLFYTHGYGVVANPAGAVDRRGQPAFRSPVVAGLSDPLNVPIEARIYFGESEEVPFVVVGTKQRELDHPVSAASGSSYVTNTYGGTGGIRLDGFLKRAAFAWRFRDLNLLLSGAITDDSRIMIRRQILRRIAKAAPFLTLDGDPYPAVIDRRLVWIVDGYTTSGRLPYSQRSNFGSASGGLVPGSGNYIRDSVKFLVDAENGTVKGYVWDDDDPVLRAWLDVFPGIFEPRSEMPQGASAHVRYPEGIFQIQSDRFTNYHVTDAGAFYQKEDAWLIGRDPTFCLNKAGACKGGGAAPALPPYYMQARMPGDRTASFVLVRPFTPAGSGRQNMVGYLVAHGDARDYGRLVSYEFPGNQVFGPEQVQANINQDPAVSQQIALWNQQHSRVIYGNLLIIPLADSLLYVQPLYLRGEGSQIPELKRVVVVVNGEVAMADTLDDALQLAIERTASTSG